MKTALITGTTGQDGSYLAELLLEKGYDVHGTIRRSSVDFRERIAHLEGHPNFHLHYADLGDSMSILQVVKKVKPNEIYNLAAQSHVQVSFDSPEFTADVDATGVLRILEAVRRYLPYLSGFYVGVIRESRGSTTEREYPIPSLLSLCRGKTVWILDYQGIPRSVQYVLLFRYSVQS